VDEDLSFSQDLKEKEDVSDWAKAEIDAARAAGLTTEHTNEYMKRATTRFQFAELIVNLTENVTGKAIAPAPAGTFTDCDELAVRKAYAAGIVNGMTADTFVPDATTNREQIATMIYRAIRYIADETGTDLAPKAADISAFSDKDTVSSWALEGGIVTGDSMRARGYGAARRTSFMIYTMTALDWVLLGLMVALAAVVIVFALMGSTAAEYTPALSVAAVSGNHLIGLIAYCLYLLIPTVLHIKEAIQWHISRSKI
jgi:hypothetical protein